MCFSYGLIETQASRVVPKFKANDGGEQACEKLGISPRKVVLDEVGIDLLKNMV